MRFTRPGARTIRRSLIFGRAYATGLSRAVTRARRVGTLRGSTLGDSQTRGGPSGRTATELDRPGQGVVGRAARRSQAHGPAAALRTGDARGRARVLRADRADRPERIGRLVQARR